MDRGKEVSQRDQTWTRDRNRRGVLLVEFANMIEALVKEASVEKRMAKERRRKKRNKKIHQDQQMMRRRMMNHQRRRMKTRMVNQQRDMRTMKAKKTGIKVWLWRSSC